MTKIIAAVVKNDRDQLLTYTTASSVSLCEERAEILWGPDGWYLMQLKGCRIVNVYIEEINDNPN